MPIRPEQFVRNCSVCKSEVVYPDFKCPKLPGNHRVEAMTYYHMGGSAIRNERDRRSWAPQLMWSRPDKLDSSNKMVSVPPLEVHFQQGGLYVTEDPEIQFHIETNSKQVGWGRIGREQWEKIYLSTEQRKAITEAELEGLQRKVQEQNTLLDQQKAARTAKPASTEGPNPAGELATIGVGTDGEAAQHGKGNQRRR